MACCADGTCTDPQCYLCTMVARGFVNPAAQRQKDDSRVNNPTRDGDPKLSGAKERKHPAFEKRQRQGPNYVPRDRRV